MNRSLSLFLVVGLAGGCASAPRNSAGLISVPRITALEADIAFARLAHQVPPGEAFARYTDPRSVELVPDGPPVVGTDAIRAGLAGLPAGAFEWQPQGGETARSGDLAWTWGTYVLHGPNGDVTGKYVSIWHLRPDGNWTLAVDIGNQVPPATAPAAAPATQ